METSTTSHFELGIFLPVCNHGWIMSSSAPDAPATFELNKQIAVLAEEIGFDFLLAQSVWRGHGGKTHFWEESLECFTTMAALAAVTQRLGLVASVQPLLYSPAVAAKMVATIDNISQGRAAINVVAGAHYREYDQMGLLPQGFSEYRYDFAAEWLEIVKRLWTEEKVSFEGQWNRLEHCICGPKPLQSPHPPIICAGASPQGMAFTATHGTHAFIGAPTLEKMREMRDRYQDAAQARGRSLRIYTPMHLILGETDEAAQQRVAAYSAEPDIEAIQDFQAQYMKKSVGPSMKDVALNSESVFFGNYLAGSPQTIVNYIESLATECLLDGLLVMFPDWINDMECFAEQVMPVLRDKGIVSAQPTSKWGFPLKEQRSLTYV